MRKYHLNAGPVLLIAFVACVFPSISRGYPVGDTDIVPAGLDKFATQAGTFFDIPGIGPGGAPVQVNFLGVPNAQGVDTIIERLGPIDVSDTIGFTDTGRKQMQLLDLKSTAPVTIGGVAYTVLVNLNPAVASTGTLVFTQTVNGEGVPEGTFVSTLDVHFTLTFENNGVAAPCPAQVATTFANCDGALPLMGNGFWTDDRGQDWIVGEIIEKHPGEGQHVGMPVIPEPGSLLLMGAGLLGGVLC